MLNFLLAGYFLHLFIYFFMYLAFSISQFTPQMAAIALVLNQDEVRSWISVLVSRVGDRRVLGPCSASVLGALEQGAARTLIALMAGVIVTDGSLSC